MFMMLQPRPGLGIYTNENITRFVIFIKIIQHEKHEIDPRSTHHPDIQSQSPCACFQQSRQTPNPAKRGLL